MIIVIIMIITPESILIFPPSQGSHKGKLVPDLLPQLLDLLRIWTFISFAIIVHDGGNYHIGNDI